MSREESAPLRRLRFLLRDHRVLEAHARIPEGQYVATYLASRNRYMNLLDIEWLGTGETVPHMALKVETALWCASRDDDVPLASPLATATARRIEVELAGGYLLGAGLLLVEGQRLSDYLQAAPRFVPLRDATLMPRGKSLGDIAINQDAIQLVRELTEADRPMS